MSEDISVAAAILTAEFVRKGDFKEAEAYLLWRRLRQRMQAEIRKEDASPATEHERRESSAAFGGAL